MKDKGRRKPITLLNNFKNKMKLAKKIIIGILIIIALFMVIQIVNAAKYKMLVNVVEGENVMGVNPLADKLDFGDLSRNNGMTRFVSFENNGRFPIYIAAFKVGSISDLVEIRKNFFTLEAGKEVKIPFEIDIPPSAETKEYSGWVWIFRLPKLI